MTFLSWLYAPYYQIRDEEVSKSNAQFSKHLFSLRTGDELIIDWVKNINEIEGLTSKLIVLAKILKETLSDISKVPLM
jgi:hypothetical protein